MAIAKANKDYTMESIYNGKQLAYKISMNSVYGCEKRGPSDPLSKLTLSFPQVHRGWKGDASVLGHRVDCHHEGSKHDRRDQKLRGGALPRGCRPVW
jgi:hypothetical protein